MSKVILINGASRGIGHELVLQFSKNQENRIIALGRNVKKMQQSFAGLNNVQIFSLDLEKSIPPQLDSWVDAFSEINVLINNAGFLVKNDFKDLRIEDFKACMQVNFFGQIELIHCLLEKLEKGSSHVVNISSMGAFQGSVKFPGLTAYAASKSAIVNFTEVFSQEFSNSKIRMNCLCLGAVQTEMLEEAFPGYKAPVSAKEMASFIMNFALNSGAFLNGKIIPVSSSTP